MQLLHMHWTLLIEKKHVWGVIIMKLLYVVAAHMQEHGVG
jgi:hypothetical protein